MKSTKIALMGLLALIAGLSSCSSDDDEWNTTGGGKVEMASSSRAFILNEGSMGRNNSNIIYFDWASGIINPNCVYTQQNGRQLGDTGNDILTVDNDKIVVAVNVSNYITLLDGYGVEKSRISFEQYSNLGQVRNVDEEDGIIYATSYGGYVSRIKIDGTTLVYMDSLRVGDRPEDVVEEGGKLYVTLQGANYTDNRLAIVESDFSTISYANVMTNPANIYAMNGKLYIKNGVSTSWGVYDPSAKTYTTLLNCSSIGEGDGMFYIAYSETDWSAYPTTTTTTWLQTYDPKTNTFNPSFFKNVPSEVTNTAVYSISVNPYDGKIYVATSTYTADGTIYVFDSAGNYLRKFSSCGINPHAIVFLK